MKKFSLILVLLMVAASVWAIRAEDNNSPARPGDNYEIATFAGGCFWSIQKSFDKVDGVVKTTVGFTGGTKKNPTYEEVCYMDTGHAESIEIVFDPARVTYDKLLDVYWMNIDPTDKGGQFVDRGDQYRPVIFYHGEAQKKAAEASKKKLEESGRFDKPIVVEIIQAVEFYPAEEYHQEFYRKNPIRYASYRFASGRDGFIEDHWGEDAVH
jgi:methionine-S-sulfoxide reductase